MTFGQILLILLTDCFSKAAGGTFIFEIDGIEVTSQPYVTPIFRSAPPATFVASVQASFINGSIIRRTIDMQLLGQDSSSFILNGSNILTKENPMISKEVEQFYYIEIRAILYDDESVSIETGAVGIHVVVSNINKFPPVIHNTITYIEHPYLDPNHKLVVVNATDEDTETYNAKLMFALINMIMTDTTNSMTIENLFAISENGTIFTRRDVTMEYLDKEYILQVAVRDKGSPSRTASATVTIVFRAFSVVEDLSVSTTDAGARVCFRPPTYGRATNFTIEYRLQSNLTAQYLLVYESRRDRFICRSIPNLNTAKPFLFRVWAHSAVHTGIKTASWTLPPSDPCMCNPCENEGTCVSETDGTYHCNCKGGRHGLNCELFNPCQNANCSSNKVCYIIDETDFECACTQGTFGHFCEFTDYCMTLAPCQNDASCQMASDSLDYICNCTTEFTGKNCSMIYDPCESIPCNGNGKCSPTDNGVYEYACTCHLGFSGLHCEINNCENITCQNGGACEALEARFNCTCATGFSGTYCEDIAVCGEETISTDRGVFRWTPLPFGSVATLPCPRMTSDIAYAYRECDLDSNGTAIWKEPKTDNCSKVQSDADIALMTLNAAVNSPIRENATDTAEIEMRTNLIESVVLVATTNFDVAKKMVSLVSSILDVERDFLSINNTGGRINDALSTYCANVDLTNSSVLDIQTDNIQIHVEEKNVTELEIETYRPVMLNRSQLKNSTSISIPKEAFENIKSHTRIRIIFRYYTNSKLFVNQEQNPSADGEVLTATIKDEKISNINGCVNYHLITPKQNGKYDCVYWDTLHKKWSKDGVITLYTEGNITYCCSRHLSSFAVLFDADPHHTDIDPLHKHILTIMSYAGTALSIVGLLITLLTYSLFRCFNREKPGKILIQLCISMLLMNISYVTGSVPSKFSKEVCIAIGVILHYTVLSTFFWMSIEAFNLYRMLVTVFKKHERLFLCKRCIIAWGMPLIPVIVVLSLGPNNYSTKEQCSISPENPYIYYGAYFGIICVLLLANIVAFVALVKVVLTPRFDHTKGENAVSPAQVRGVLMLMATLGISWIFGALSIKEAKIPFQYLFVITNSLQGFLIFLFRCLLLPDAKAAWQQLLTEGTFKKYKGKTVVTSHGYSSRSSQGTFKKRTNSSRQCNNNSDTNSESKIEDHCTHNSPILTSVIKNGDEYITNAILKSDSVCDNDNISFSPNFGINIDSEISCNGRDESIVEKSTTTNLTSSSPQLLDCHTSSSKTELFPNKSYEYSSEITSFDNLAAIIDK